MSLPRLVLIAAVVLLFWGLGSHDLWAPDEPYFGEGAREMVADGKWAVPHVNGVVTTDKPPLFFWLIALFSLPFGDVIPWTVRLPSALSGVAMIALTLRLGRRFYDPRTAALAGFALLTSVLFWEQARWGHIDAFLCLLIWIAVSAFEAYRAGDAKGLQAGLVFWGAAALAVLAKGPVGLLLPLGIVLLTLALGRDMKAWRGFAPLAGPLLFAVLIGAWIVLATVGGQGEYSVWGALKDHFIYRSLHGIHHKQPFWYYAQILPVQLLPWSGLLPGALLLAWRRRHGREGLLLSTVVFVLLVFSLSTEKRGLYLLPIFPALALMIAGLVGKVCGWTRDGDPEAAISRRWLTVGQLSVGGLFAGVAFALPLAARKYPEVPSGAVWAIATALLLAAVGSFIFWRRGSLPGLALAPAIALAIVYLVVVSAVYPAMEGRKSARPFSLRLQEITAESRAAGLPVVSFFLLNLPEHFAYHTRGMYTVESEDPVFTAQHLNRPEKVFAAVDAKFWPYVLPHLERQTFLVDQARLSRMDVWLVVNQEHGDAPPLDHTALPELPLPTSGTQLMAIPE